MPAIDGATRHIDHLDAVRVERDRSRSLFGLARMPTSPARCAARGGLRRDHLFRRATETPRRKARPDTVAQERIHTARAAEMRHGSRRRPRCETFSSGRFVTASHCAPVEEAAAWRRPTFLAGRWASQATRIVARRIVRAIVALERYGLVEQIAAAEGEVGAPFVRGERTRGPASAAVGGAFNDFTRAGLRPAFGAQHRLARIAASKLLAERSRPRAWARESAAPLRWRLARRALISPRGGPPMRHASRDSSRMAREERSGGDAIACHRQPRERGSRHV
jgi:hypothetical protein